MSLFETIMVVLLELAMLFGFTDFSSSTAVTPTVPSAATATVVSVIDGDTIMVMLEGREEMVRYIGIDTPEPRREGRPECGSHEATAYNTDLVAGKVVRLVADVEDRDRFDRLLRYVYVQTSEGEEVFVNEAIIRAGLARPLRIKPNDTYAVAWAALADEARANSIGNWGQCVGV